MGNCHGGRLMTKNGLLRNPRYAPETRYQRATSLAESDGALPLAGRWVGLSIIAAGPIELTSYVRMHLPYLTPYASFQWALSPIPCFGQPMSLRNDAHEQIRGPMLEQCVAKARHESSVITTIVVVFQLLYCLRQILPDYPPRPIFYSETPFVTRFDNLSPFPSSTLPLSTASYENPLSIVLLKPATSTISLAPAREHKGSRPTLASRTLGDSLACRCPLLRSFSSAIQPIQKKPRPKPKPIVLRAVISALATAPVVANVVLGV
ncbi:uncharacterized protein CLUP02_08353 [Colletotrichum lupini]|uniref:Uncharacterized protein n=1 Tax=Colletotrichum lupini TaxID=145971 RepID=A0A9Q8STE5_9PEZI|nr:uncharacterized protein CLUP02_08353 [Colletotrichum lupini]UQC82863.1 hypothetical protein CLUP02_08353 [Colletotrichum lupini]